MSLKLYDAARVIANPFAYAEARERTIADKMAKLADSRIRARKDQLPKVNKALAEKILRDQEREAKKQAKKLARQKSDADGDAEDINAEAMDVDGEEISAQAKEPKDKKKQDKANVLTDPRFKDLFENPEFQVDESSREFALLNPATVAGGLGAASSSSVSLLPITSFLPETRKRSLIRT